MATKIEWTEETWNPATGCTKLTQGCKNCYAKRLAPKVFAGQTITVDGVLRPREFEDVIVHPERLDVPLRWAKPKRIFVNSMSDLFHEDIPDDFIDQVFGVMAITTRHTFQILTKRADRMLEYVTSRTDRAFEEQGRRPPQLIGCPDVISQASVAARRRTKDRGYDNCGPLWPCQNVWLGVSVEDQATADVRIPLLLKTPAAIRFLSCEPLLGPIDIDKYSGEGHCSKAEDNVHCVHWWDGDGEKCCRCGQFSPIDWVIAGGESGPNARPSHPDWFRSLRDQCASTDVPFFFKQWGEWVSGETEVLSEPPGRVVYVDDETINLVDGRRYKTIEEHGIEYVCVGKKAAGRLLDGRLHDGFPA